MPSTINPDFLGYRLDLDRWRAAYMDALARATHPAAFHGSSYEHYARCDELELLGFVGCCHWLNGATRTGAVNYDSASYGLKHTAERMMRARGGPFYVSKTTLEMAALHEGMQLAHRGVSPNASINISPAEVRRANRAQPSIGDYYWFQHQPVLTYPVTPERLRAAEARERGFGRLRRYG